MTIKTPDIPGLWGWPPDPPILNTPGPGGTGVRSPTRGQPPFQQRPPLGPSMPSVESNDRMFTGAPTFNPDLPPGPLPPFERHQVVPNARSPITGAPLYFRSGEVPEGWET